MNRLKLIPREEFERIRNTGTAEKVRLALIADMCRANTLTAVKLAGSGHLGSSFSAMDIVVLLYYRVMNTMRLGIDHPDRDIYFSSKGHDVPGLYSVLHSLGVLSRDNLLRLRRLGGLDGHPDIAIPGIESNSGSLGMGISKGKGMALAKAFAGRGGRVFVLTGDGELQEGQVYEALQSAVQLGVTNLHVIVDHNKVQSDKLVREITDLGNLEEKFRSFGWHAKRCDGHDFASLEAVLHEFETVRDKPKILIADTIKGRGVSFMEHPQALREGGGLYRWHAGAPADEPFWAGYQEITGRINALLEKQGLGPLRLEDIETEHKAQSGVSSEYVAEAFGRALVDVAKTRKDLVVLDADLAADCRLRYFEEACPERFIENGIAEQDMVSTAGGLALQGFLPVVNSFAAFLASRSNEQIYTNACEGKRIIYVCHYAGLIPAGPGKSHQSVRDISLFGALPGFEVIEPCNGDETRMAVDYCVNRSKGNCVLRLVIGPSPRTIELPREYRLSIGKGVFLKEGTDGVLFSYGPVMLHEALKASDVLQKRGVSLAVMNMPWLNAVDRAWFAEVEVRFPALYVLEDHCVVGGLGDRLLRALVEQDLRLGRKFRCFGVEGFPACGAPLEVLRHHRLDGESLAERLMEHLEAKSSTPPGRQP